jgi:hypothetical protein
MSHAHRKIKPLSVTLAAACAISASIACADTARPFCDLTVKPRIIGHQNHQVWDQIVGDEWPLHKRLDEATVGRNHAWLKKECANRLRKHYAKDIVFDDGFKVFGRHYYCGQVKSVEKELLIYERGDYDNERGYFNDSMLSGTIFSIAVMRADPIYAPVAQVGDIHKIKCEKLRRCRDFANAAQIAELDELGQELSCF